MPETDLRRAYRAPQRRIPEGQTGLNTLNRRALAGGLAVVAAAGIPALAAGYGSDPDAWLVARAAGKLWTTGTYVVSRFPGYPLHEIASAPLVGLGGCVAANAGTLVASLVLTALWFRIARRAGRNPLTLFFSLVCAPLVLTNVATTMDYLWSLAFLMAALDAALEKREIASGVLTGIASGFRPSNLSLVIPLCILVALSNGGRASLRYAFAAAAASAASFLPVLVTYGGPFHWFALTTAEMSDVHPAPGIRVLDFGYRILYAAGPLAFIAIAVVLAGGRARLRKAVGEKDPIVISCFAALIVAAAQFFALPLERAYLLPALPFALLLADTVATPRASLAVFLCIVSLNVVNPDIIRHQKPGYALAPNIHDGRLQESWRERTAMADLQDRIRREGGKPLDAP
ncbi:MAG TPA: hypothetical protein VMF59_15835 [Bacteroidota bacterium]|nr:hypothetical protein [Bacteroidota bacterium]